MNAHKNQHRTILQGIARRVMLERGLFPDFSAEALAELDGIQAPASTRSKSIRDLRHLPWASIDNDDTRDLDQLTVAEKLSGGKVKIMVALADVDSIVKLGSAIDEHARNNTTSVYTAAKIFLMLPEKLSTNLTSLNFDEDRLSIIIEIGVRVDGSTHDSDVYRARVCNHAKLAYNSVAAWLEGNEPAPEAITAVDGLAENLRLQDETSQKMKNFRHLNGALHLEGVDAKLVFDGEEIHHIEEVKKNRATDIIEDFMIAANGAVARYLSENEYPSIRRVVRTPKRWDRIVEIARDHGTELPDTPDPIMLDNFLLSVKVTDPLRFPDLSLSVIKLLGSGEYVAEFPGEIAPGHFSLAVSEYTHSTGPNRRYPDLITQRLLKTAVEGKPSPYSNNDLEVLAAHCTEKEGIVKKIERIVNKSAAALLLESRIGEQFEAIVTGAASKGTWVRLLAMPVEGKLVEGFEGLDVGNRTRVQLISVDVGQGFIDFKKVE